MPTHVHIGFAQFLITLCYVVLILFFLRAIEVLGGKSDNALVQALSKAVAFIH